MKLLIVDGISETRNYYLENISDEYKTDVFHAVSAEDAVFMALDIKPDIIISSEILSFRSGFDLSRIMNKSEMFIPVILIANDTGNAIEAINTNVFDFLLMPLAPKLINYSIKKAINYLQEIRFQNNTAVAEDDIKVRVKTTKGYRLIDLAKLLYCKAEGAYTNFYFMDGTSYYSTYNLGRVENLIGAYRFIRINRSAILNLAQIKEVNKKEGKCILNDEKLSSFSISKTYIRKLEEESIF